jgi:predicted O-linked N-acetylglucosamine transferase (SPINDLY family)
MESAMQGLGSGDIEKAVTLFRGGNAAAAAQACKAILHRDGRNVAALYLLALTAMQQHDIAEAERIFAKVTKIEPNSAEIWANRANNLIAMGKRDRALKALDRALAIEPALFEALYNRAKLLGDAGHLEDALASYDKCLEIMPQFADALNNRGTILDQLGRHDEALAAFDRCLAITPNAHDTLNNRGNLLAKLERNDEALASYDKCITLAPAFTQAWLNVGMLLIKVRRYEEAAKVLGRALELDPRADVIGNLVDTRQQLCDWDDLPGLTSKVLDRVQKDEPAATPFVVMGATDSSRLQLQCARALVAKGYPAAERMLWLGERYTHERIRIAYLSADFRDHPVAYLIAGLFEHHDRAKFETIAISFSPDNAGEMHGRVRNAFEKFVDVRNKNDREVARLLRELEVDIAVDLMGFTKYCRLGILAFRPAPIQVNYLGYPGTIGADYIDYIIGDRYVVPAHLRSGYSEHIVYLPDTFQANDAKRPLPARTPSRAEIGLPERGFVFCSFNNAAKVTPAVFDIWMQLLRQVENSVLWILADSAALTRNLRKEAQARGIVPDRLVLAPRVGYDDYLARYRLADLFLDTLPFNGGTTVSDALWAGLPVVSCSGEAFAARMAGSLLNAIGLPELITQTLSDYERLALKLATDAGMLADIRAKLSRNRATFPLFDTDRFRRHIESAFATMHERHRRGEPPASFSVSSVEYS